MWMSLLMCYAFCSFFMWVFPKIGGFSPKMDGENSGNPMNK